jgi:hypothetical protein
MPHFLIAAAVALTFALGDAPTPAPGPDASPLPEIGRVRATAPACAAMRDLVVPSFAAARRADARFAETRVRLPSYIQIADDPAHRSDVVRESALAKLDADATTLLNEAAVLNRALGDARFKNPADPQVAAQRDQLQQLYAAEQARASQLQEFVMRERNATAHDGFPLKNTFGRKLKGIEPDVDTPPAGYVAPLNPSKGMPVVTHTTPMADVQSLNEWSGTMAATVRASENLAAHTFLPIAQSCR